jgi:hypothetical protein
MRGSTATAESAPRSTRAQLVDDVKWDALHARRERIDCTAEKAAPRIPAASVARRHGDSAARSAATLKTAAGDARQAADRQSNAGVRPTSGKTAASQTPEEAAITHARQDETAVAEQAFEP